MKRTLLGLAAASLLIGAPLAASARDGDHDRRGGGGSRHEHHRDHWQKQVHVYHYYRVPPRVVYYYPYYRAPVAVAPRVYVPAPYPYAVGPRVSIGFGF